MKIKKSNWLKIRIKQLDRPIWQCPTCNLGSLDFPTNWAIIKPNAKTIRENDLYLREFPDEIKNHFTGFLKCSNTDCGENVAVIGESSYSMDWDEENHEREAVKYYIPKYFYPPIHIFELSQHCPQDIRNQVINSFSHFFADESAAANAIRTALEIIMDDQKVKKSIINSKNKRETLKLHARIDIFGKSHADLKPYLIATKWIGNAGSHVGAVSRAALLDGYELLEHCIDELYDKPVRMKELTAKAKNINRSKKPITEKKK